MKNNMEWFKEEFLPAFKIGEEIQIDEDQFLIFEEHLPYDKDYGYAYVVYGNVGDLHIEASRWTCHSMYDYSVTIKKLNTN